MRRVGTTTSAVNLRAGPGTEHPVLRALPPKTQVDVVEQHGYWLNVVAGDQAGFVHVKFVLTEDKGTAEGFIKDRIEPPPAPILIAAPAAETPRPDLATAPLTPADAEMIRLPAGATGLQRLVVNTWNKYGGLLTTLSQELSIDPAVAVAVLAVESGGRGFGPDGRMLIRFENQIFFDRWGRTRPEQYAQHFRFNAEKRWTEHQWRPAPDQPWRDFHGSQAAEWAVFTFACSLNDTAAKLSISMGGPQIMGFNYAHLGFESVQQMFDAFCAGERQQVVAFFDFVQGPGAASRRTIALQERDFITFAAMYNGPGQAARYGSLIRDVFDAFHALRP